MSARTAKPRTAIVFGGAGFLGSYVADELTARGYQTTICDLRPSKHLQETQRFAQADLLDVEAVRRVIRGHDAVFNFAGLADINIALHQPLETIRLNVLGNTHVLEACRRHPVSRYVYASSAYAYSTKGSFYGVSKHASEKIIEEYQRQFGVTYTILRYGSVYGPRADDQNRIYRLVRQALTERKMTFRGDGDEVREYIHVRDAAKLSVDVLAPKYANQHLMLTGIERFRYRELLDMIKEIIDDKKVKVEFLKEAYRGHYVFTPYSFNPAPSRKLVNNPFIDMGQGLVQIVRDIHLELSETPSS